MNTLLKLRKKIIKRFKKIYYSLAYYIFSPKYGINTYGERERKVIVSLTSYPARFSTIHICIKSLLNQTCKPDKVILYLGKDCTAKDITKEMKKLENYGLEIKMGYEDIRPHKKYYYAMQEYPNDIVVTVDDDVIYDRNLIESLMESYSKYPYAVSARRVHNIIKSEKNLQPYNKWEFECTSIQEPSMNLIAIGVGGILYPPACMSERVFDLKSIKKICLNADDIWLKFMQVINSTPVVWVDSTFIHPVSIRGIQGLALNSSNLIESENDLYINKMEDYLNIKLVDYIE
ncbi:glycosyltransferase [Priestia megaterium]|uniref:glycosyltransferase n=1 Tax=Priestia megaterium TaxID=1404 RepID=UPI0038797051